VIILKDQTPIAQGSTQTIYPHPDHPERLIKVRKLEKLQRKYNRKIGGRLGYKRRHGLYVTWMRELEHYFSITLRLGRHPIFLQQYYGVVDTDLGLGLVVGKEVDRDGNVAPTLQDLAKRGAFTREVQQKLQDLLKLINELRISTTDVNMNNIVYSWSEDAGDHLVMIEGIGVNTFIPLARFSNYLNIRSNNRHFERTYRSLRNLKVWHPD